jgi:mannose-6-phosphate isomerase-like protein (cupin superfamily)
MRLTTKHSNLLLAALSAALALGWSLREAEFARAAGKRLPNTTLNLSDVKVTPADYEGKPTGKAAVYFDGESASLKNLQVGRFLLNAGSEPHPPHRHVDEELLIVSQGTGEMYTNGKTYPIKPGAIMYCDPNVEHGIKNTGKQPLEFFWVKYVPRDAK